jgi:hypothetical protein
MRVNLCFRPGQWLPRSVGGRQASAQHRQHLLFHRVGVHLSAAKPSDRDAKEKLEQNALDVESMYLDYVLARQKLTLR